MEKEILEKNIDKIHTTKLGEERIQKNLKRKDKVIPYCIKQIKEATKVVQKGKNYYVETEKCILTIHAKSYTIITAHLPKDKKITP